MKQYIVSTSQDFEECADEDEARALFRQWVLCDADDDAFIVEEVEVSDD